MRILILDTSLAFVEAMTYQLRKLGLEALTASVPAVALTQARIDHPQLVLANIALLHGTKQVETLSRIRRESACPIVLRGDEHSQVLQNVREQVQAEAVVPLGASAHKVMKTVRQALWRFTAHRIENPPSLTVGDVEIDPDRFEARVSGRRVQLSVTEMEILYCLGMNADQFVSREALSNCIWCSEPSPNMMKLINAHMRDLRLKIEPDRGLPRYLLTKRSIGYMLCSTPLIQYKPMSYPICQFALLAVDSSAL